MVKIIKQRFWKGAVKLTFNARAKHDPSLYLSINNIIENGASFGIFTTYCFDIDWFLPLVKNINQVKLIAHHDREHVNEKSYMLGKNIELIYPKFPSFPNWGIMHAKLFLLQYEDCLRIVISTANLMDFDYELVQNAIFIQDIPKSERDQSENIFFKDLCFFLKSISGERMQIPSHWHYYCWENVLAKLVYSIPGYNNKSGMRMLQQKSREIISTMMDNRKEISFLEYQCSSLGKITNDFLQKFWCHSSGKESSSLDMSKVIHVVFPSDAYVKKSLEGPEGFGTVFGSKNLPNDILYECESVNPEGIALHSKIFTAFDMNKHPIYTYIGSANFTSAAWGRITKSNYSLISNYELGVLITDSLIPYPYKIPSKKYGEGMNPWIQ